MAHCNQCEQFACHIFDKTQDIRKIVNEFPAENDEEMCDNCSRGES